MSEQAEAQLQAVLVGLAADPSNEQLLALRGDLEHLIGLTRHLNEVQNEHEETEGDVEQQHLPDSPLSDPDVNIPSSSSSSSSSIGTMKAATVTSNADVQAQNILSPFIVGDSIEVISGDRPYAAVVKELNPGGKEGYAKVWYFEYDTDVVLPLTDFRKI